MEEVKNWLQTFPGWGEVQWSVDMLPARPGNAGLFPKGDELLEVKKDLLGNVRYRCRRSFQLLLVDCSEDAPQRLLQLQDWVRRQSAMGLAPKFGDAPENEYIRAEKGHLKERTAAGSNIYAVTLVAEFVKKFEG